MIKAVTYARVSSAEQRDTGYSIPAQEQLFQDYAKSKKLNIVKAFQESESAKNSNRKLFKEMLAFVKENQIKAIVFEKVDRMTRNFNDLILIYDLMETTDIQIHLIKNGLVLDKNAKSQEKFQLDIHVVMARNYINNLSEEIKKGIHEKRSRGGWNNKAPFGYRNIRINDRAIIEPDEDAFYAKQLFEAALSGKSVTLIYNEFKEKTGLSRASIHNILKNVLYAGYIKYEDNLIKGKHKPLIELSTFELVQKKLSARNKKQTAIPREFRFSGLLKCGCGTAMYGELKKGKYTTYGCGARIFKRKCTSTHRYFSEKKVVEQLGDYLAHVSITEEDRQQINMMIQTMFDQMEKESTSYGNQKHTEIQKLKAKINRLLDHYDDGLLTRDEYLERKESLTSTLQKLQSEYDASITVPLDIRENFKKIFEPIVNLHQYWLKIENYSDFQSIMNILFTNLVVKDGILHIYPTKLAQILYKTTEDQEWWTELDDVTPLKLVYDWWVAAT